ncbi:hypothetical protein L3X07_04305 [Levilactobacillus brevis]|nr:hypothetical protein [Levilactobacillus brevis]
MLTTNLAFPLVYTQLQVLTTKAWHRLSLVDRERSLTQARCDVPASRWRENGALPIAQTHAGLHGNAGYDSGN